jgi:hypothetical protein
VGLGDLVEESTTVNLLDGDVLDLRSRLVNGLGMLEGSALADSTLQLGVHLVGGVGVGTCGSLGLVSKTR